MRSDGLRLVDPSAATIPTEPSSTPASELSSTASPPPSITVTFDETPAMGADGSLYFKNVAANGRIVAFNPSRQEIGAPT